MNRFMNTTLKRIPLGGLLSVAVIISLAMQLFTANPAFASTTSLPVLWTAGGLDSGSTGAGQAARMTVDPSGNVTVVSGPGFSKMLVVTSYTSTGARRWQSTLAPISGTFGGSWIAAAPNGDIVALGLQSSTSSLTGVTLVRYASDGTFQWRVDSTGAILSVQRLIVDAGGNAYFGYNSTLYKYSPSGTLLWSTYTSTPDVGAALSPDGADLVLTGSPRGGANWVTAVFDTTTGARRWLVTAPEGNAARDVVVDSTRVYVTGTGVTGAGTPGITYYLTVVAYDRATGARLWRTNKKPIDGNSAAGLWMTKAPDGSLVVTGQTSRGFLDWYTVAFEITGVVRWETVRDGGLNTDEIPASVLVLSDGTTVVTGRGGPNLPGGYIQGVTAGYGPSGTLLWEAFSKMETVWATALPSGNVCAAGGYDALITCWQTPGNMPHPPALTASPMSGSAPLTVTFTSSAVSDPNGPLINSYTLDYGDGVVSTHILNFGDGVPSFNDSSSHTYVTVGSYTAILTVTYNDASSASDTLTINVNPLILPTNTGFLPPSANAAQISGAGDNNGFQTGPANAYADDALVASDTNSGANTSTSCTNNGKDKHRFYNFNFNLPTNAVIQGIQVRLDARADATVGSPKICIQFSWDGGTTWTTAKSTTTLSTTEATYTLGSSSDTWGRAWIPDNFSNANFRARIISVASNTSRDFFLDYIAVNVTYQP